MINTKILFTDLDGTLLNDEKLISYENKQAIQKALQQNHKVVITTGRPLPSALLLVDELGLNTEGCYVITYNGGVVYDCFHKEAIFKNTLPLDYINYIFEVARKNNMHCNTYSDTHVISEKKTLELEFYCDRIKTPYQLVDDISFALKEEPVKAIMLDRNGRDKLSEIQLEMADWCNDKVNCCFSSPFILEFGPLLATKGNALKFLCNHLHIPIENAIAVGDEENDISMIQEAGVGVVMANADDTIKKYGDYITKHNNNNHAISEVIHKFML